MIRLKDSLGHEIKFEITKFPDGTSQVWKLEHSHKDLNPIKGITYAFIDWVWEGREDELFHLVQLVNVLRSISKDVFIELFMPYFPYARQDKKISNNTTFAVHSFKQILLDLAIDEISGFDLHSKQGGIDDVSPLIFHQEVIEQFKPDVIMFPDTGAYKRYYLRQLPIVVGEKCRQQETGILLEYKMTFPLEHFPLLNKRVLIVDDICDGGATFILAAKELKEYNVGEIGLCVSHGIFSKGLEEMQASGISQFYYTNSLLKNKEGYKVWE